MSSPNKDQLNGVFNSKNHFIRVPFSCLLMSLGLVSIFCTSKEILFHHAGRPWRPISPCWIRLDPVGLSPFVSLCLSICVPLCSDQLLFLIAPCCIVRGFQYLWYLVSFEGVLFQRAWHPLIHLSPAEGVLLQHLCTLSPDRIPLVSHWGVVFVVFQCFSHSGWSPILYSQTSSIITPDPSHPTTPHHNPSYLTVSHQILSFLITASYLILSSYYSSCRISSSFPHNQFLHTSLSSSLLTLCPTMSCPMSPDQASYLTASFIGFIVTSDFNRLHASAKFMFASSFISFCFFFHFINAWSYLMIPHHTSTCLNKFYHFESFLPASSHFS